MCLDGEFMAAGPGLSRMYAAENMSVAKWLDERRMGSVLDLLLIVNPLGDLDGADREGDRVRKQFEGNAHVRIHELRHEEATWTAVKAAFSSGRYDMVHYAGHALFNAQNRRKSGILCHGHRTLTGSDLAGLSKLPALVFFNACESARVRGKKRAKNEREKRDVIDHNVGLAEAFLRGGIATYVGTYWPVGDEGATRFCEAFYGQLLAGEAVGAALAAGRKRVRDSGHVDWADYIHYGNPNFVLKSPG
jgi:CHAT domain-containing protein